MLILRALLGLATFAYYVNYFFLFCRGKKLQSQEADEKRRAERPGLGMYLPRLWAQVAPNGASDVEMGT